MRASFRTRASIHFSPDAVPLQEHTRNLNEKQAPTVAAPDFKPCVLPLPPRPPFLPFLIESLHAPEKNNISQHIRVDECLHLHGLKADYTDNHTPFIYLSLTAPPEISISPTGPLKITLPCNLKVHDTLFSIFAKK